MIPVPQRIIGALQDSQRGDCYKCCIASILELPYEDVPHFSQGEPEPKYSHVSNLDLWMKARELPLKVWSMSYLNMDFPEGGFDPDDIHAQYLYESAPRNWHPGYWIACVKSRVYPQSHHAIVMKDKKVAFDPSPGRDDPRPYEFCGEDVLEPDLPLIARTRPECGHCGSESRSTKEIRR